MQPTLGQPIDATAQRDAIHVAIAPVVAPVDLQPGEHVDARGNLTPPHVGVVDPFRTGTICAGDRFYLCLYPNTVTSLRHEWEHPAFNGTEASREWLEKFAYKTGRSYASLLGIARESFNGGTAYVGDDDAQDEFNEHKAAFLHHAAAVLAIVEPFEADDIYFRCAC